MANTPVHPYPTEEPLILPSILSADFARAGEDILDILGHCKQYNVGGGIIHVDVMDGHLVPNISFGPPVIAKLRKALPSLFFDVHLMIDEPVRYAPIFRDAGADQITFHVEAPEVKNDIASAASEIRKQGCHVGITLKPGTPAEAIYPALDGVDMVLIMSVEPGFGGQKFMPEQLNKARLLKSKLKPHQRLEIDGGINPETITLAREAGIQWFVIGSALFDAKDRNQTLRDLANRIGVKD